MSAPEPSWPGWEPAPLTEQVLVAAAPVRALQSLFDDGLPELGEGDELPPLWHWVALPEWATSGVLGPDGHPRRGSFLPPVELPRRMFAGGTVEVFAPLVIVTVRIDLSVDGVLCVSETQDLIYREAGTPASDVAALPAEQPPGLPLTETADGWRLRTDPSLLARFSAATANAHRIHYDWPYATGVEGYPGLVVHGPLLTLALVEASRLAGVTGVTRVSHRNLAPLFCAQEAEIRRTGTGFELVRDGATLTTLAIEADTDPHEKEAAHA